MKDREDAESCGWRRLYPTQAALDAEFTLDTIPDLDALRRRRDLAAGRGREEFRSIGPLAYGSDPDETLLVFPPSSGAPTAPAQVFFHGGFWSSMQASDFAFLARGFVPFGAALVLVDYPLIPRVRLADIVASCRKALVFLHRHGPTHGIDPRRLFISGNSAGGHLVAEFMDDPACGFVQGVTAISGLYDLAPVAASFRNELLRLTPDDVATLSPLRRPARSAAPLIVAVGALETAEFLRQSADFVAHVAATGALVEHIVVPDANHITIVLDVLADPGSELNRLVRHRMA